MEKRTIRSRSNLVCYLLYIVPLIMISALSGVWYIALLAMAIAAVLWLFPFRRVDIQNGVTLSIFGVLMFLSGIFNGILLSALRMAKSASVMGPICVALFLPMVVIIVGDIIVGECGRS